MSALERVLTAEGSSDLGEAHEGIGDVDWIRAAGIVARQFPTSIALWRLTERHDLREFRPVFNGLLATCIALGVESNPHHVVSTVLQWMLYPTCDACHGRGYELVGGTPHLSDRPCPVCEGSGKKPQRFGEHEHALYERVQKERAMAAAAIARLLKDDEAA